MDLSIIIPIYNTPEDKLKRCLNSIDIPSNILYEIILIDDGSEKYIENLCKQYILKDRHFIYFKQINRGVSIARNNGISKARGKYLTFVDADDMVFLQKINREIFDKDYQLIIYDMTIIENNKQYLWKSLESQTGKISLNYIIEQLAKSSKLNGPVAKFISTKFLKEYSIKFNENMKYAEDLNFLCDILLKKPQIFYQDIDIYHYYREHQSDKLRLDKYSDVMLHDTRYQYKKLRILVQSYIKEKQKRTELIKNINIRQIKTTFSCASELSYLKKLNNKRKDYILKSLKEDIETANINYSLTTNVKLKILLKEHWKTIKVLSILRELYLKIK